MKLQTQFALAFIPLFLLSGGGMTYIAQRAIHRIILEQEFSRGQTKLEEVATQSLSGFETRNETALLPILTSALTKQDAVYVMAVDANGEVLAHTNVLEKGKYYADAFSRRALSAQVASYQEIPHGRHSILDISWPVWGTPEPGHGAGSEEALFFGNAAQERKRLGVLRMGFSLENAEHVETKILGQLAVLLFSTDFLLLSLAFVLMRRLLFPINNLVKATEEIGSGIYGAKVAIPGATELALLAHSFNRMSDVLQQTTVSKNFLDDILANMLEPLILVDTDYTIRMVNRAALQMLGYEATDLLGQPVRVLANTMDMVWQTLLEQTTIKDQEILLQSKSAASVAVLLSASTIKEADGKAAGFIIVAKDMRERKKMEADMLQSEKLSAVGRLASGVAHEINNPLGVILGFAQGILMDMKEGDPLTFPLKSIERESVRCKNLVSDLLTFSRVSKSEREPLSINTAVEGAYPLIVAQARLRKVDVVQQLTPGLPIILANINQIQQIIINLANNGMDAMKEGGTLTIRTEQVHDGPQSWVSLIIADTGSGIPADILPRIFEPFFTTKPIGQGTGLGLGLVHEMIKKHSGRIDVESQPGRTCFTVQFPAQRKDK